MEGSKQLQGETRDDSKETFMAKPKSTVDEIAAIKAGIRKVEKLLGDIENSQKKGALIFESKYLPEAGISKTTATPSIHQDVKNEKEKGRKTKSIRFYLKEEPQSKYKITSPWDVYYRMMDLAKADQESFWVLGFDISMKEIYRECLFIGGLDHCDMDFRIIFKRLLPVGAASFIAVHNHPSGDVTPSKGDKETTDQLKKASEIVGLKFLDHVIIGSGQYCSLASTLNYSSQT